MKKKRKNKLRLKKGIIEKISFIVYFINILLLIMYLFKLNIIPNKFMILFIGIFTMLLVTVGLIMFKLKNKKLKIITYIIIFLSLIFSLIGYNYSNEAFKTLDEISNEIVETEDYYIVSSIIKDTKNLNNKYLYIFENNEKYEDVTKKVNKLADVNYDTMDSLDKLAMKVVSLNDSAILVSASQYLMMCEDNDEFEKLGKIIYTIKHVIGTVSTNFEIKDEYTIENGKFNVFISGVDSRGTINNVANSDANMLITIDMTGPKIELLMTSIPRDYYVELGTIGQYDKLTHSGVYGINETITTIEKLLDVNINYYARVSFSTITNLVDAIGGIEIYSFKPITTYKSNIYFNKGINYANGEKALAFARERRSYIDGDIQRSKNQQIVVDAIIKKMLGSTTLITNYKNVLSAISSSLQTNVTSDQISYLVKNQLNNFKKVESSSYSLTGSDSYSGTYSYGANKVYVMIPNQNTVEKARENIKTILE